MKVTRGKKHVYLGMDITYGDKGEVIIRMTDYIKEAIEDFQEACKKHPTSPAAEHIFQVRDDVQKLCEKDRKRFHRIVLKFSVEDAAMVLIALNDKSHQKPLTWNKISTPKINML